MSLTPFIFTALLSGAACAYFLNRYWRKIVATSMNDFVTEVEETETVITSAITLITGMSARIKELVAARAGLDAFAALADRLDTATGKLAEAVAAVSLDEPVADEGDALPPVETIVTGEGITLDAPAAPAAEGITTADTPAPAAGTDEQLA